MAKSTYFANKLILHIFQNAAIPNIGDVTGLPGAGSSGSFYIGLHTADPTSGDQQTSEATYTSYARVPVVRTSAAWSVTGGNAVNISTVAFPQCTGGSNVITHFSIGTANSGAGTLIYCGALTASLTVSNLILPEFTGGTLGVTEA